MNAVKVEPEAKNGHLPEVSPADDWEAKIEEVREAIVPSPSSPPLVVNRYAWIDLPPAQYPGFRFRMWVNYPQRLLLEILNTGPQATAALHRIVLEHNHWQYQDDESGEIREYPQPPEPRPVLVPASEDGKTPEVLGDGFWELIPNELGACILTLIQLEPHKLPNSLRAR